MIFNSNKAKEDKSMLHKQVYQMPITSWKKQEKNWITFKMFLGRLTTNFIELLIIQFHEDTTWKKVMG